MIYLSGKVNDSRLWGRADVGLMLTPHNERDVAERMGRTPWAADTGLFTQSLDSFDMDAYLALLRRFPQKHCLFATAPDVVGDAELTWEAAVPTLPAIREAGFRAALVAQDGLTNPQWTAFDCLFVGGSTEWKLSEQAYSLAHEAKRRNKWVHMGRVNSWRRLKAAAASGYDSVDGTFVVFGPDKNIPRLNAWMAALKRQPVMEYWQ